MIIIKKNYLAIVLAIVILSTTFIFYIIGGEYLENKLNIYDYTISVKGLDNYTSFGATDIIVPIPMKNNEQVFSDDELQYKSFGDWKSVLVVTKEGKMLAFQTTNTNLTNINASFKKFVNYCINIENPLKEALLYPASNETSVNYTTYVYIDPKIQTQLSNSSITFEITLYGGGEAAHSKRIDKYRVDVHENIPEGIKGPILVKAWIFS